MKRRRFVNVSAAAVGRGGVLYGAHAVLAWLGTQPSRVRAVWHEPDPSTRALAVVDAARALGIRLQTAEVRQLTDLAGTTRHQGLVADVVPFPYAPVERIVAAGAGLVVIGDHLQDPHNLGAILRTAEAVGAGGMVIPRDGAVGVTAVVEATAAGAAARLPVARVANVVRALELFKGAGYWAVGLAPGGGVDLYGADLPERVAIVVGGEDGLRPLVERTCDWRVRIPMAGQAESLNASVAAAVVLYELFRRRRVP